MKKIAIYSAVLFLITSCELTDVLENDPPNNLVSENVVKNETDARALLNGVYTTITSRVSAYYYMYSELIPSALVGTMSQTGGGAINGQFSTNDVLFDNTFVRDYWLIFYKTIDQSNNAIARTSALSEWIGRAK